MGPPKKSASGPAPDPFYEKPSEVTVAQWDRLLEARTRKMQQEEEVKKLTAVMNEMQGCLSELTANDDANRKQIELVLRSLAEFRENREKKRKNMIVPLRMKQGLVEADLKPLEGEYSNVGLLPRAIIIECNEVVLMEANSKIDMMKKMRAWKADNNLIKWEITRLKLQQQHVAEKIRHLQLLRVTKGWHTGTSELARFFFTPSQWLCHPIWPYGNCPHQRSHRSASILRKAKIGDKKKVMNKRKVTVSLTPISATLLAANQNVIKTGEDPSSASEALALANRLDYNSNLQEKRRADKEYVLKQLVAKSDLLRRQNVTLLKTASELHKNYTFQYRVCGNALAAVNKEKILNQHFRTLSAERKLKELAHENADRLEALRKELETTRARIVPILPKVQQALYAFPHRPLYSDIGHMFYAGQERATAMQYKKTGLAEFQPAAAKDTPA